MYYITTTRFNNETFSENRKYCEKHDKLYYGSPIPIKDSIKKDYFVIVLEMNNDENKVVGIGLIKNNLENKKLHHIYKDRNYNRYIYQGINRIDREEIDDDFNKKIFELFDLLLFKGAKHLKRSQGISEIPMWLKNVKFNYKRYFDYLFRKYKKFKIMK